MLPFPSGTAPDIVGRLIAQKLSDRFGQQYAMEQGRCQRCADRNKNFPRKTLPDLMAYAKRNPKTLSHASMGQGGAGPVIRHAKIEPM